MNRPPNSAAADEPLPERPSDGQLDAWVRDHLRRLEAGANPEAMLERIRESQAQSRHRRLQRRRLLVGMAASVFGIGGMLFWDQQSGQIQASPERLVEEARQAHAEPIDRCYQIHTHWDPAMSQRFPVLTAPRTVHLWTRGDRFWVESIQNDRIFAWGRDDEQRVWMAPGPKLGLLYEPNEVSEPVLIFCELCSLEAETLLGELLRNFRLRFEANPKGSGPVILAEPRFRHPMQRVHWVRLELDPERKFVRRLEMDRRIAGQHAGTIEFVYSHTERLEDGDYSFRGHLHPDATILDQTKSRMRDALSKTFTAGTGMPPIRAKDGKELRDAGKFLPKWRRDRPLPKS
ncbi:hypothetical protein [Tuwongella immobilis]|uniref:Uncharacterized protein n=1 Tax=Tuwongella immobilis TaxID=692036 RepID=A0A6C2YN62_9BACT|nr:hypothetical protein [Tuwongella immobilis]VIP02505.1 Uncharacterized protein OS=Planctomyces brasiliensis (strain ATCC 49424 / DSM 5305 / JCM 21570 / NBRC 103401 / IFAM 1448) GN=Plabr_3771 PE=4 SV=1 [Tuwongella immobilis]VTS01603.1 Uncharacterized protein OS=Planctomyces brasiliensis (strain ATCC 49424 / DSM 5305 / JCM 21570 / NBRC 103401 / IFAM 1448) GN=Plabr_3771 PE=4 SV=1 [Tuwongella immobilis]